MKTEPKPRPVGPPPVGKQLRAAAGKLAEAMTAHLAGILDAFDEFRKASWDMPQHDRDLAALLLKGVRDGWAAMAGHRDECHRLTEES